MSNTVHVKNISSQTSEKEVRDFFSFCGKISAISVTPSSDAADSPKSATVTFEKETAAKTALLLDNTQLGPSSVQVSSAANLDDIAGKSTGAEESSKDENDIAQEDKPRSRIIAEYLAHGYVISDGAIQRAISLDQKHGFSSRFTQALSNFDSKYHATDKAKGLDSSYGITEKANAGLKGLNSYFEKALETPTGQRVRAFYTQGDKQVRDIHNEARRLADLKSGKQTETEQVPGTEKTTCKCGSVSGKCACAPGTCACANCAKSDLEMHEVPGTDKTTCNCGGQMTNCACASGHCACSSCPKNPMDVHQVPGEEKTVCSCGGEGGSCQCEPGKCSCSGCAKSG